jgi:DNA-binding beta-propeller fold protein YncE
MIEGYMMDPNNRPGGPNLIVTCKSANTVQFFDAATHGLQKTLEMPGSTHEMAQSADGSTVYASIYGGGIFGKNSGPDRRIAVIDLRSRTLIGTIDVDGDFAPHSVMMDRTGTLWATAEMGQAMLAIDTETDAVQRIDVGGSPHWLAISHQTGKVFGSFKATGHAVVVDLESRMPVAKLDIPHRAEGLAVTPDGETLFVCAHERGEFHEFDTRSHKLRRTIQIEGAPGTANQLRRVRVTPDGRYVLVSSHVDNFAAIYEAGSLKQIASIETEKAPMGFGFAPDGVHAYLCCHDSAQVLVFEIATGRVTATFATDAGCEFVIAYA